MGENSHTAKNTENEPKSYFFLILPCFYNLASYTFSPVAWPTRSASASSSSS